MELRDSLFLLPRVLLVTIICLSITSCTGNADRNQTNTDAEIAADNTGILYEEAVDSLVIRSQEPVGNILAAVYQDNNAYLLDGIGKKVIRIASIDGNTLSLGGNGRGPGEYVTPSALEINNDNLWVLDRNLNRINQYINNEGNWLPEKSGSTRIRMSDLCFVEKSGLWVFGSDGNNVIHRLSNDMTTSEFSTGHFNADDPIESERVNSGLLACNNQIVASGYTMDNRIRLYDAKSGDLVHEIVFEEIVPIQLSMIQRDGGMVLSRTYSQGAAFDDNGNYQDNLAQILFIDDNLLVQYKRNFTSPQDDREHYVSFWVNMNDYSYKLNIDIPFIADYLGDGRFLVAYNNPEPVLVLRFP